MIKLVINFAFTILHAILKGNTRCDTSNGWPIMTKKGQDVKDIGGSLINVFM